MNETANHALQRTVPRVTPAAADDPATCAQPAQARSPYLARRAEQSVSLGSLDPIKVADNPGGPQLRRHRCDARQWPVKWQVVLIFLGTHLALGAAPFVYTNTGAILGGLLAWITVQFGMSLGYHRLITHRSYSTPRWLERLLALTGCLSAQSGPITWVAIHRLHHRSADHEPDPHTPLVSFLWAQCEWTFYKRPEVDSWDSKVRLAADVAADPFMRYL